MIALCVGNAQSKLFVIDSIDWPTIDELQGAVRAIVAA